MIALISKYKLLVSSFILIVFYSVGIWGIAFGANPSQFILLTPLNLLITLTIVLTNHSKWNTSHLIALIGVAFVGFIIEMIGVNTGVLFGEYTYGKTLGWSIVNTPLMIGVNWLILVYGSSNLVLSIFNSKNVLLLSFIAASLMVALDVLIEPVAIYLDMWSWASVEIPLQNYLAWWILAFILNYLMIYTLKNSKVNPIASVALGIQFLFFLLLNFILL